MTVLKKRIVIIGSAVLAAAIVLSFFAIFHINNNTGQMPTHTYSTSYINTCSSFEEAYEKAADVIVGNPIAKESLVYQNVVATDVEVEVLSQLKGEPVGDRITVVFTGGVYNNERYVTEQIKIPDIDSGTYLFLLNNQVYQWTARMCH